MEIPLHGAIIGKACLKKKMKKKNSFPPLTSLAMPAALEAIKPLA
jgi:hypothetical protein